MHSPLIMAGPGIGPGKTSDALCYLLDLFPTLGELCAVPAPEGSEGKSLAPVLAGKEKATRDVIFTAYTRVNRAIRDDRWKLIVYTQVHKTQLFDLRNDSGEMKDLAGDPAHAEEVTRLTKLLAAEQKKAGDTLPLKAETRQPLEFDFSKVPPVKKK